MRIRELSSFTGNWFNSALLWKVLFGMGLIGFTLPILLNGYHGTFSRYMADDYATASTLDSMGFLPMQVYWYTHWSGRFVFYILIAIAGALGDSIVPYLPAILLLILVYEVSQIFSTIFRFFQAPFSGFLGESLGLLMVGAAFSHTPTIVQSLYWQTGSFTYTLPIVFFLACLLILCKQYCQDKEYSRRPMILFPLCFLLATLSAGLSESFLGVQLGVLATILVIAWIYRKSSSWQKVFPLIISAMVGTVLAAILVLSAPGNAIRQATLPAPASIPYAIKSSLIYTATYLWYTFSNYSAYGVLLFIWPAVSAYFFLKVPFSSISNRILTFTLLFVPVLGFLLWAAVNIPSFYAMWSPPSDRVIIIHHFIFCFTIVMMGLLAGIRIQRSQPSHSTSYPIKLLLALVMGWMLWLGPIQASVRISKQTPIMQQFAREWDIRNNILVQAAQERTKSIVVPKVINISELDDIGPDPTNFWNRSMADYYHLAAIHTE